MRYYSTFNPKLPLADLERLAAQDKSREVCNNAERTLGYRRAAGSR